MDSAGVERGSKMFGTGLSLRGLAVHNPAAKSIPTRRTSIPIARPTTTPQSACLCVASDIPFSPSPVHPGHARLCFCALHSLRSTRRLDRGRNLRRTAAHVTHGASCAPSVHFLGLYADLLSFEPVAAAQSA